MNKIKNEILEDIRFRLIRNQKKECLILLNSLQQNFKSKYSYYFYYFFKSEYNKKYNDCTEIIDNSNFIFTINEIRRVLHCRELYKNNFHLFKLNVLDKLIKDFNIDISVDRLEKNV